MSVLTLRIAVIDIFGFCCNGKQKGDIYVVIAHAVLCLHSQATFGNIDVVCSCPGVAYRFVDPKQTQWISYHHEKRLKTVTKTAHHNLTRANMT